MQLPPFVNEPYADFTQKQHAPAMQSALSKVRAEFGREYPLLIAGEERTSAEKVPSVNPSAPAETIGIHQKGSEKDANDAVDAAFRYFPTWSLVRW